MCVLIRDRSATHLAALPCATFLLPGAVPVIHDLRLAAVLDLQGETVPLNSPWRHYLAPFKSARNVTYRLVGQRA